MKRRALLIGNSNGLGGVKIDIANYIKFLTSDYGGLWYGHEIIVKMNPTKKDLLTTIENLINEKPDLAFVVFSGHGGYEKSTILEINNNEEYIIETDLIGISKRQISIFDCCRNVILTETFKKSVKSFSTEAFIGDSQNIRAKYDLRIMQSIEQQIFLYACSINESALDTEEGGLYSKNLLGSSRPSNSNAYKLVGETHEEARLKTINSAWVTKLHRQNPTATLPRCLSSQQLIFSINPYSMVL